MTWDEDRLGTGKCKAKNGGEEAQNTEGKEEKARKGMKEK